MMRMTSDLHSVWRFVHERAGVPLSSAMKALGLERDGVMVAGVLYDGWNGVNLWMHSAIEPGAYLGRTYPWYVFAYPFTELGARRLTGWVEASNAAAVRFNLACGFRVEHTVVGAATDGGDALLMVMRPEDSVWLRRPPRAGAPSMAGLRQQEIQHGQQVLESASARPAAG